MTLRKYDFVHSKYETLKDYFKVIKDLRLELKKESNGHVNFYYKDDFILSYYATTGTIHCDLLNFRGKNCSMYSIQEVVRLCVQKLRDKEKALREELNFHTKKARELQMRLKSKGNKKFRLTVTSTHVVEASDIDFAIDVFHKRINEGRAQIRHYIVSDVKEEIDDK